MPLVSVVIPCLNAERWIGATLTSVTEQNIADVEIIVVDDGSVDRSAHVIARDFPETRLIRCQHAGPSRARNVGTQAALGRFIQYLDADDLLARGKLARQVEALEISGADVAYGDWRELRPLGDGGYAPGRQVLRRIEGDPEIALFTDFWCPPAVYLFRRRIVEEIGSWNEGLPIIQDARFVLDCALRGARFAYCDGVMADYRVHTSNSVSTRDPREFSRDCLRNALDVQHWWHVHGGLTEPRRDALVKVYGQVARSSYATDRTVFDCAWNALKVLEPAYVPRRPRTLRWLSLALGYPNAEAVAAGYRMVRRAAAIRLRRPDLDAVDPVERHARLRRVARSLYRVPGVRTGLRHALRRVLQHSRLPVGAKQRLHNFFAVDVAPVELAECTVEVPGARTVRLRLQVRDGLSRSWYFWGYSGYELGTTRLLQRLLQTRRTFFDVGANVGYFTIQAAALLEGRGEVHAFEPWSTLYTDLSRNAQANRFTCLRLNRAAASNSDGQQHLFLPGTGDWTTASLVGEAAPGTELVPTVRLDSYCRQHGIGQIDLIKIDVEGAELAVLEGMGPLLARRRPDIVLEVLEPYAQQLEQFFAETPYRKFRIRDTGLEELEHIVAEPHERNVYLSCDPTWTERD